MVVWYCGTPISGFATAIVWWWLKQGSARAIAKSSRAISSVVFFWLERYQNLTPWQQIHGIERAIFDGSVSRQIHLIAIQLDVEKVFLDRVTSIAAHNLLFAGDYASFFADHFPFQQIQVQGQRKT